MKTLVVDDDLTCRLVLEEALARYGGVDTCADGSQAVRAGRLALAVGRPYDLICMDIMMPTLNGLEALRLIRQEEDSHGRPRASKVVVVSSSEDPSDVTEAFGELCDAYLTKPIEIPRLLDLVECLCDIPDPHAQQLTGPA
jgi:two-component system, chemotaxis family, chemotaxis protein CheY